MPEISDIYNSARKCATLPPSPEPEPNAPPLVSTPDDFSAVHGVSLKRAVVIGLIMIVLLATIAYIEARTSRTNRARPDQTDELELFEQEVGPNAS